MVQGAPPGGVQGVVLGGWWGGVAVTGAEEAGADIMIRRRARPSRGRRQSWGPEGSPAGHTAPPLP